ISVLLLVCAGLFVRTLSNMRALDLGIKGEGVVSFFVTPPRQAYGDARAHQYFRAVLERLNAPPGIRSAAYSWTTPYLPMRSDNGFFVSRVAASHAAVPT